MKILNIGRTALKKLANQPKPRKGNYRRKIGLIRAFTHGVWEMLGLVNVYAVLLIFNLAFTLMTLK